MISSSAWRPPARSPVWILKRTYCIRRGERAGEASAAALKNVSACFKSPCAQASVASAALDRKSTRLNSSHLGISYSLFCFQKREEDLPSHPGYRTPPTVVQNARLLPIG